MSNNGQAIQAFNKKAEGGFIGAAAPMALMVSGAGLAGLALITAVAPAQVGAIAKVADLLNRVGLDKGPLFLFGATIGALGFALSRVERAASSASRGQDELGLGEQIAGDLEGQSAIMAALQGELGAARTEIAELHRETQESAQSSGNTASDPMFRLAASLDQLGAQIGKHLDAVEKKVQSSIATLQISIRESDERLAQIAAKSEDDSQAQQATSELQSLRSQVAGLTDSVDTLAEQVKAIEVPAAPQPQAPLPWELAESSDAAEMHDEGSEEVSEGEPQGELSLGPEPAAPVPSSQDDTQMSIPEPFAGSGDEDQEGSHVGTPMDMDVGPVMGPMSEQEESSDDMAAPLSLGEAPSPSNEPSQPTLFGPQLTPVMPVESEFPNPPAPMPQPSEGLELIDDMNEDKARLADLTPPLFPEMGDGGNG